MPGKFDVTGIRQGTSGTFKRYRTMRPPDLNFELLIVAFIVCAIAVGVTGWALMKLLG